MDSEQGTQKCFALLPCCPHIRLQGDPRLGGGHGQRKAAPSFILQPAEDTELPPAKEGPPQRVDRPVGRAPLPSLPQIVQRKPDLVTGLAGFPVGQSRRTIGEITKVKVTMVGHALPLLVGGCG